MNPTPVAPARSRAPAWARLGAALLGCLLATALRAETVLVAVAANFQGPLQALALGFERETGHTISASFGATGKFHAQIRSGAPFQILLAADALTPELLEREHRVVPGTRFTYAIGRLALWSARPDLIDGRPAVLQRGEFKHLAIANPKLAPYGAAALQVLGKLGLRERLAAKLVQGESIAQAYQFVASGNAELGFVALAQIMRDGQIGPGSAWLVPPAMHDPIRQDAVLLLPGRDRPAALALLRYLQGDAARALIQAHGYGLGTGP